VTASTNREAPAPPPHLQALTEAQGSPEILDNTANSTSGDIANKRLPRETGEDIGMGSPVPLSSEAVGVITRLRNMKVNLRFRCIFLFFTYYI
jgi:tRNA pseudouridine synthase 9